MTKNITTKATTEKTKKPRKRANSDNPFTLSDYHKQALIGLTNLRRGDVSLEKATSNSNVRLRFDQSISIHSEYIHFLYELFKVYCTWCLEST